MSEDAEKVIFFSIQFFFGTIKPEFKQTMQQCRIHC